MRRLALIAVPLLAVLGVATGALARGRTPPPVIEVATSAPATATPAPTIQVDVVGAIAHPGVVRLPLGSRVLDALLAAGGMTGDADLFALNKAALLRDGSRIYVPKRGETPPAGSAGSESELKIDLNEAIAAQLDGLPGLGPATAARIVRSREQRRFSSVNELQTRGLVTPKVLADIRDQLIVR